MLEDYGRIFTSEQRKLKRSLDDATSEQQAKHIRALDYGLKEHQRVRESAERELELIRLENEREARRKAELQTQRIEEARRKLEQQKEDEQRRRVEEQKARQEEERRREELRKQEEENAQKRAAAQQQRDQEEAVKRQQQQQEKQDSDRKAREEAEAKQREQQAQKEREIAAQQPAAAPAEQPNGVASSSASAVPGGYPPGFVSTPSDIETKHRQYLELHQRLKAMRKHVEKEVGAIGKAQKDQLSEWRRSITKAIGMLRKHDDAATKSHNRDRLQSIMGCLDLAARTTQPMIDITQYIVDNGQPTDAPKEGPGQLLFLLNHFVKSVFKQLTKEVALEPDLGNALGILVVTVFARPNYLFNGQSLIDILWAKYHRHCPVLFGISGNEMTVQGRKRMGWFEYGECLPPEQFFLHTRGYAIGFANITLRSFAKSQNRNPAPNRTFWQSIARILNTPSNAVQPSHFEALKAIVEHTTPRITSIFGNAGLALVRQAVIAFPTKHESSLQSAQAKSTVTALKSLPHILLQKYQLAL